MTSAEEVKSKLDIVEIIQEYLPLKKRGASYFALCPFHNEKTPSFHISRERQFYKCFGCGEGGDVFAFVQKMEGMDFLEALRHLAEKAGVKIEKFDPKVYSQKNKLFDLIDLAARYYHEVLLRSHGAEEARAYLKKRGLAEFTVDIFNLGFAPSGWDTMLNFLVSKKYSPKEIFDAGLAVKKERGEGYYDRFRSRIMFPIHDEHGRTVGFTARLLPSEEKDPKAGGKYINTPQTEIYNKSRVLYGLDLAKREIKNQNLAILVEGNMDVISCHEIGMKNVVAASGTALTFEQVALLKRFTENIAVSFDMDKAGELAAEKGIGLLLESGMNIRVITLPAGAGKDPDEAVKKNSEVWKKAVEDALPVMEYLFLRAETRFGRADGEARKNFGKMVLPYIVKISDKIEQTFWIQKLAAVLQVPEEVLLEYLKKNPLKSESETVKTASVPPGNRYELLTRRLLSLIFIAPQNFEFVIDRVTPTMLGSDAGRRLYEAAILLYNSMGTLQYPVLKQKLQESGSSAGLLDSLERLIMEGEAEFGALEAPLAQKEMLAAVRDLREFYFKEERKNLTRELQAAESSGEEERAKEIFYKIQELHKSGGEHYS